MGKIAEEMGFNKTKDEKVKAYCSTCIQETNHLVLQSVDCNGYEVVGYYQKMPETIDWSNNYQIIQCCGCDTISFRHRNWCSENQGQIGPDMWDDGSSSQLYPHRSNATRSIHEYYSVPSGLRRIYCEAIECFNGKMPTLCAAGLRAIIEGVCADQKITDGPVKINNKDGPTAIQRKKTLQGKIAGLGEKGILSQQYAEILHEHRFLGNDAVHDLSKPSFDELVLAIDIVEHMLESLYEVPQKADDLRGLRLKRSERREKSERLLP